MTNVVASTAEEDIGESFINAQEEVPECTTLIKMGYPQPPTKIQVDNTTSNAFTNKTWSKISPRPSTCASIGYKIYAPKGDSIFLKTSSNQLWGLTHQAPPPAHHWLIRHKYLHTKNIINQLKVCFMQGFINSPVHAHSHKPVNSLVHAHSRALVNSLVRTYSHALVNFLVRSHYHATVNSSVHAHSRAPDNTLQKPHSTITMARTKYGPIRAWRSLS